MTHSMKSRVRVAVAVTLQLASLGLLATACGSQRGATQQALAQAKTSQAEGAQVYSENCQICHGDTGQGGPGAPPVMGGSALPVKIRKRSDSRMDREKPGSVRREAYDQSLVAGSGEREQRMRFRNAKDIFTYVTEKHPPMNASLEPAQYWSVLSYVLDAHGLKLPAGGLNEKNAESVPNAR